MTKYIYDQVGHSLGGEFVLYIYFFNIYIYIFALYLKKSQLFLIKYLITSCQIKSTCFYNIWNRKGRLDHILKWPRDQGKYVWISPLCSFTFGKRFLFFSFEFLRWTITISFVCFIDITIFFLFISFNCGLSCKVYMFSGHPPLAFGFGFSFYHNLPQSSPWPKSFIRNGIFS